MATSSPPAVPPASTASAPAPPSNASSAPRSSPSPPTSSPPSQPNANPPVPSTPSTASPPPQSPAPTIPTAPPPATPSTLPPPSPVTPPPPARPPSSNADPPSTSNPPPLPSQSSPSLSSPPPARTPVTPAPPARSPSSNADPPYTSNPPPLPSQSSPSVSSPPSPPNPSATSSPPPASNPTTSSPAPPSSTPPPPPTSASPSPNTPPSTSASPSQNSSPPRPSSKPPENPSPPPVTPAGPPNNAPPPPTSVPPAESSPPPPSTPPKNSPPPPPTKAPTPSNAPPPTRLTPPTPLASQPTPLSSNSTPRASPPTPVIRLAPPPPSLVSPPSSMSHTVPNAPETSNLTGNGGVSTGGTVAIGVAVGIILLSLIGLAVCCMRKRRKEVSGLTGVYVMPSLDSSPRSDSTFTKTQSTEPLIRSSSSSDFVSLPTEPGGLGNSRPLYAYEELVKATNGFSSQNLLGEGGFGAVYKGFLPDGREVAVKQLKVGGGQGEREFKAEVEIISRIHHRHLVSLVGYCISGNRRLLVYDYVPNNTLHFHLHGLGRPVFEWALRVKIAAGAARGLAYLHEGCHPRIFHRDIKSSNILLDNNYDAKVSDFGLAKLALDANTHVTTRVMGTFGYMAPEYARSGMLTEKSDVFSYGVVLLELITGRKPVDASQPLGDESLVEWARPLMSHALDNQEFEALADPRLGGNYLESEMFGMIQAAAACVRHSATKRPRMGQVVRAFDSFAAADLTNGTRVGESELFNSEKQSEEVRLFQKMAFGSQNYSTDFFSQGDLGG